MVVTITDVLNHLNDVGVFSYVIPFLLIFAVVYAILDKTKILGDKKGVHAIVGIAIGLLALQFDVAPRFFSVVFPKFGVGLAIFLVLLIFIGFFYYPGEGDKWPKKLTWIGYIVGIGVAIWAITSWDYWGGYDNFFGVGGWFYDYFWALIVLAMVIGVIVWATSGDSSSGGSSGGG